MATAVETGLNEYLSTTAKLKIGSLFGYIGVGDENKILVKKLYNLPITLVVNIFFSIK